MAIWLTQRAADVPTGDGWLGEDERRVLATLVVEPRRLAWRLGRWTGKAAIHALLGVGPRRIQILAAADGAPEVWLDGERLALSVSLSHRGDRALAAVADGLEVVGCDLEAIEPRSDAFVREWLAPAERELLGDTALALRPLVANLIWSAKESAAKVRREGLRLDVGQAVATVDGLDAPDASWQPLRVAWADGAQPTTGWWHSEPGWVMALAARPCASEPRPLASEPRPLAGTRGW